MKFAFFNEPIVPFIHVSGEDVDLILPITQGHNIATDNTCRTFVALYEFHNTSKDVVRNYINTLNDHIQILSTAKPNEAFAKLKAQKQQRLNQLIAYDELLAEQSFLRSLASDRRYPLPIHALLYSRKNYLTMLLRPSDISGSVKAVNPIFSLNREAPASVVFLGALKNGYAKLSKLTIKTPSSKQQLKTSIINSLKEPVDFNTIKAILPEHIKKVLGLELTFNNFYFDPENEVNQANIDEFMGFNTIENGKVDPASIPSISEYIDALMELCHKDFWENLPEELSPFYVVGNDRNLEELCILTQFFFGVINIYCFAGELTTENFGTILDDNQIKNRIPQIIFDALKKGSSVELALLDLVNKNYPLFGLKKPLTTALCQKLVEYFADHYMHIKTSRHYDEHSIRVNKAGPFRTLRGSIGVSVVDLINLSDSLSRFNTDFLKGQYAKHCDQQYINEIKELSGEPYEQDSRKKISSQILENEVEEIDLPKNELIDLFFQLLESSEQISQVIRFLFSETETNERFFQRLSTADQNKIKNSKRYPELLLNIIEVAPINGLIAFYEQFDLPLTDLANNALDLLDPLKDKRSNKGLAILLAKRTNGEKLFKQCTTQKINERKNTNPGKISKFKNNATPEDLIDFYKLEYPQDTNENFMDFIRYNPKVLFVKINGEPFYIQLSEERINLLKSRNWFFISPFVSRMADDERSKFEQHFYIKDITVQVTHNEARSIHAATMMLYGSRHTQHLTLSLSAHDIGCTSTSVITGFEVSLRRNVVKKLEVLLRDWENKVYLTSDAIKNLRAEALFRGIDENNITELPQLLEALQIPFLEIIYPEDEPEDILIELSSAQAMTKLTNYEQDYKLQVEFKKINEALINLEKDANADPWIYGEAFRQAQTLFTNLKQNSEELLQGTIDFPEFKNRCRQSIQEKRPLLEEFHGWSALLTGLMNVINTLVYVFSFTYCSNFFQPSQLTIQPVFNDFERSISPG